MSGDMDRIRDEMAHHPEDGMLQAIGDHMTAYLKARPEAQLKAGATIKGAISEMSRAARKTAKSNVSALDFLSGMKIVYEHFGLEWDKKLCMSVQMSLYDEAYTAVQEEIKTQAPADEFDLDAFLGGGGL